MTEGLSNKKNSGPGKPGFPHNLVIVFARYPEPGTVKTRLVPTIGIYGSARLQREMTRLILGLMGRLPRDTAVELSCAGGNADEMSRLYGWRTAVRPQAEGDLGARMHEAMCSAFKRGARKVLIIGSDCPSISCDLVMEAFKRLDTSDCVFGPADDGGYYLVGLKKPAQMLFNDMRWSQRDVLSITLVRSNMAGLRYSLLRSLGDIDRASDLPLWKRALLEVNPPVSVIIPAFNEEDAIARCIGRVKRSANVECIVVDGGSTDRTVKIAEESGAVVVHFKKGRGLQMNKGAMIARSEMLLFLHADTLLPDNFDQRVRASLSDPRTSAGAFRLSFDSGSLALKIISAGANLRSRFLGLPYGDQGLFMWKADYHAAGGFPEIPILEEIPLVSRLKALGRIAILNDRVITSCRRYVSMGIFSACASNLCAVASFFLGAGIDKIAGFYHSNAGTLKWFDLIIRTSIQKLIVKLKLYSSIDRGGKTVR